MNKLDRDINIYINNQKEQIELFKFLDNLGYIWNGGSELIENNSIILEIECPRIVYVSIRDKRITHSSTYYANTHAIHVVPFNNFKKMYMLNKEIDFDEYKKVGEYV